MRFAAFALALLLPLGAAAQALPRTVADVFAALERQPEPAAAANARAVLAKPAPAGADRDALVEHHSARAGAAAALGRVAEAIRERRRLVELLEGERNQPKHLIDLAVNEMMAGNWAEAERLALRASRAPTAWWGQDVISGLLLARMQSFLGDYRNARTATARIESLFRAASRHVQAGPFVELVGSWLAWAQADTQLADGQALAGERALRLAHERGLADVGLAEDRARSVEQSPAADVTWQVLDLIETQLVRLHVQQGRLQEAELAARRMLSRNLERYGRGSPSTALAVAALGEVMGAQGRQREAAALGDRAAQILGASGVAAASGLAFHAERVRIDARIGRLAWTEAATLVDELRAKLKDDAYLLKASERQPAWALAVLRSGRADVAAGWLGGLAQELERHLGKDRYEAAEARGLHGAALAAKGDRAAAFEAFAAALPVLVAPKRKGGGDAEDALRLVKRQAILEAYIGLLHDTQAERGPQAIAEAFRLGDATLGGSVQAALAASAARALAGTPQLGALIRREQDSKRELASLNDRLLVLATSPDSAQRDKAVAELRERATALEAERTALFAEIESRFPDYADLVSPRPATLADAQKSLRAGEALVLVVPGETRTFVWTLRPSGRVAFHAAALTRAELAAMVARLRTALDPGEVTIPRLRGFDYGVAHKLYAALLAPSAGVWGEAADLVVVTGGALGQLPLSLLLTEAAAPTQVAVPFAEMKGLPWLARKASVTSAPSVNAFARLRALPAANAQRAPFIGFGDPVFSAAAAPTAVAPAGATRLRALTLARVTEAVDVTKQPVSHADYATLSPLPDTREEIEAIAKSLGADPARDAYLGERASRRSVRSADLQSRRIVAFATHGLVPGDLPGLAEPALALSATGNAAESPLLTLEDVLGLKLDADWVVLSACNTAAGDGAGAEAVSGLGRGFFYAGSRALLVTHWPVETVSARLLVTGLFERYAADPALSRAQALNRAMLALIDGPGSANLSYAHPLFWAPYALIGDGGR